MNLRTGAILPDSKKLVVAELDIRNEQERRSFANNILPRGSYSINRQSYKSRLNSNKEVRSFKMQHFKDHLIV